MGGSILEENHDDADSAARKQLQAQNHQLANHIIVINWSAYALSYSSLTQQERRVTEDMLSRNSSAILSLFTQLQSCLQELAPSSDYHLLFLALTNSVNQLQLVQTSQQLAEFETLIKRLKKRMAPYLKD